jgi:hypothetical protein
MIEWYNENHARFIAKHRKLLNYDLSIEIFDSRAAFEEEYFTRLIDEGVGKIHIKD